MKKIFLLIFVITAPWVVSGQMIRALYSNSEGQYPRLEWFSTELRDSVAVEIFRSPAGTDGHTRIFPVTHQRFGNDTTFFTVFDTTLKEAGIYGYLMQIPRKSDTLRSELMYGQTPGFSKVPYVVSFDAESVQEKKAIRLEWKLSDSRTVQGLALYRSRHYDDGYELVAHLPKEAVGYVDEVDRANEPYYYFLQIRDFFGYQPPSVRIHGFSRFAEKPFPPQELSVSRKDGVIRLRFRKTGSNVIGFNLYRGVGMTPRFTPVIQQFYAPLEWIEISDTTRFPAETGFLQYYCTAVSDGFVESAPSDTVFLDLSFSLPVPPPAELNVITDEQGYPMLVWPSQADNPAVAGYNVYRTAAQIKQATVQAAVKLNAGLIHYSLNYFTDSSLNLTGEYLYEVESVNHNGKSSELRTGVRTEFIPEDPKLILSATQDETGIVLSWQKLENPPITQLKIYRQKGEGAAELMTTQPNKTATWTDAKTTGGASYIYTVMAVYTDGKSIQVNDGFLVTRNPGK